MNRGNLIGATVGLVIFALLFFILRTGDPQKMSVAGVMLANADTQIPAVRVDNIGIHGIIGDGAHTHGTMSDAQQKADDIAHRQVEDSVFKSPAGNYTQADIDRNGAASPAVKFRDMMSRHDLKTKPGDLVCPITLTKANDAFYWWIGGKKYKFCCPPCIEEFVLRAKKGERLPDPETFVKK